MAKYSINFEFDGKSYPKEGGLQFVNETNAEVTDSRGFIDLARETVDAILELEKPLENGRHSMNVKILNENGEIVHAFDSIEI